MRVLAAAGLAMLLVPLAVGLAQPRPEEPAVFLVPDLLSLPPDHVTFTAPDGSPDGCMPDEEGRGARRCLRFTTYLSNIGAGPLDLALADLGGGRGRELAQRVHATDGSWLERPAGVAEYHGIHDHYHVAGLVAFNLHPVDDERQVLANVSAAGGKTGFCLFDGFRGDFGGVRVEARTYHRWNCKALDQPGVGMGITPGWVDRYNWTLADQYLDVSGVPDGLYVLDVMADPRGIVFESNRANNRASTAVRIVGDSVEVVTEPCCPVVFPPLPFAPQRFP